MALTAQQLIDGIAAAGITSEAQWTNIMARLKLESDLGVVNSAIAREKSNQASDNDAHETALQALQAQATTIQAQLDALEQ